MLSHLKKAGFHFHWRKGDKNLKNKTLTRLISIVSQPIVFVIVFVLSFGLYIGFVWYIWFGLVDLVWFGRFGLVW